MGTSGLAIVSGGLGLVVFAALAYLVVPLALRLIRRLLDPYRAGQGGTLLLEKYFVFAVWTAVVVTGLAKLALLIPPLGRLLEILRPAWSSVAELFDILKWVAVCACILLVGGLRKRE